AGTAQRQSTAYGILDFVTRERLSRTRLTRRARFRYYCIQGSGGYLPEGGVEQPNDSRTDLIRDDLRYLRPLSLLAAVGESFRSFLLFLGRPLSAISVQSVVLRVSVFFA